MAWAQPDWVLVRRAEDTHARALAHMDTHARTHVNTQTHAHTYTHTEDDHMQTPPGSERSWPCPHLDFELLAPEL